MTRLHGGDYKTWLLPVTSVSDREYHWVKESYELGDISPQRIETTWNLSDCMTKALPRETIERLVPGLSGYGEVPKAPGPAPT